MKSHTGRIAHVGGAFARRFVELINELENSESTDNSAVRAKQKIDEFIEVLAVLIRCDMTHVQVKHVEPDQDGQAYRACQLQHRSLTIFYIASGSEVFVYDGFYDDDCMGRQPPRSLGISPLI